MKSRIRRSANGGRELLNGSAARPPEPSEPPQIRPRLSFTRKQWIGLPMLAAVPVLALFGVFGESTHRQSARSARIVVDVESPARLRYRQTHAVRVAVENASAMAIDTIRIAVDTAYIARFSKVTFVPGLDAMNVVSVIGVRPHERRLVTVELSAERYGRHRGRVLVSSGQDTVAVSLSTIVFP